MCTPFTRNVTGLLTKLPAHSALKTTNIRQLSNYSRAAKISLASAAVIGAGVSGTIFALHRSVRATELELHPPNYPWYHSKWNHSFDHASLRRGYEVYRQVCAACHSMQFIAFRHLIGVTHTEEEAKELAKEFTYEDGPDDTGKMFTRPGKLSDYFPNPYRNEEEGKAANNGVLPPDLSLICLARHGGEDYIYSILTGYCDAPAGVLVGDEQHFNPYFPGGVIGMAKALYNEIIEYEDGTPATESQLAKDVCTFLRWTSEPFHEKKKELSFKVYAWFALMLPLTYFMYQRTWMGVKTREMVYKPIKSMKPNLKRKVKSPLKDM